MQKDDYAESHEESRTKTRTERRQTKKREDDMVQELRLR